VDNGWLFLISNFRRVLNIVRFLLGNSPASEFRHRGITQKKAYNNGWLLRLASLRFINRTLWCTYVIRTYKMHTFYTNVLIDYIVFDVFRTSQSSSSGCRCQDVSIKHNLPSIRLLIWIHDRNTIKLHVQIFLKMNTWMFETCRRHYN